VPKCKISRPPRALAQCSAARSFPGNNVTRYYFGIFQNGPCRLGGKAVFQFVHHTRKFYRKVIGQNFEADLQIDRVVYCHIGKIDSPLRPSEVTYPPPFVIDRSRGRESHGEKFEGTSSEDGSVEVSKRIITADRRRGLAAQCAGSQAPYSLNEGANKSDRRRAFHQNAGGRRETTETLRCLSSKRTKSSTRTI